MGSRSESVCSKRAPRCENERAGRASCCENERAKTQRGATMTTEANVGAEAASEELKRLGFLYDYGAMAADLSAKYYDLVKKQAPQTLSPASRPSRAPSRLTAPPSFPRSRTSALRSSPRPTRESTTSWRGERRLRERQGRRRQVRQRGEHQGLQEDQGGVPQADRDPPRGAQEQGTPGLLDGGYGLCERTQGDRGQGGNEEGRRSQGHADVRQDLHRRRPAAHLGPGDRHLQEGDFLAGGDQVQGLCSCDQGSHHGHALCGESYSVRREDHGELQAHSDHGLGPRCRPDASHQKFFLNHSGALSPPITYKKLFYGPQRA